MLLRLTRDQRASLFAGRHPRIAFPGNRACPIEPGYELALSNRVSLRVTGVRREKRGDWVLEYVVADRRPRLLRSRLPASVPGEDPPGALTNAAIRRAAEESAYTHSERDAIPNEPETVPAEYQEILSRRGRERFTEHRKAEHSEEEARRMSRRVAAELRRLAVQVARSGGDPVEFLAEFERQIRERQRGLDR